MYGLDDFIEKLRADLLKAIRKAEMMSIGGQNLHDAIADIIQKNIQLELRPDLKLKSRDMAPVANANFENKYRSKYKGDNPEFKHQGAIVRQFNNNITKNTIKNLIFVQFIYESTDVYNCGGTKEMINILNIDKPSKVGEQTIIEMVLPENTRLLTDLEFLIQYYSVIRTTSIVQNRFKTYTLETEVREKFLEGIQGTGFNEYMEYIYRYQWQFLLKELRRVTHQASVQDNIDTVKLNMIVTKRQKGE